MVFPKLTSKAIFRNIIIIFTATVVIATLFVYYAMPFLREMESTRKGIYVHSDMSMLNASIREELQEYYKKNAHYPDNLQILRNTILKRIYPHRIPEEPNVMDYFNEFKYSAYGISYNLTWEARHSNKTYTHKESGSKGELARTELYIDGKLLEKNQ